MSVKLKQEIDILRNALKEISNLTNSKFSNYNILTARDIADKALIEAEEARIINENFKKQIYKLYDLEEEHY